MVADVAKLARWFQPYKGDLPPSNAARIRIESLLFYHAGRQLRVRERGDQRVAGAAVFGGATRSATPGAIAAIDATGCAVCRNFAGFWASPR